MQTTFFAKFSDSVKQSSSQSLKSQPRDESTLPKAIAVHPKQRHKSKHLSKDKRPEATAVQPTATSVQPKQPEATAVCRKIRHKHKSKHLSKDKRPEVTAVQPRQPEVTAVCHTQPEVTAVCHTQPEVTAVCHTQPESPSTSRGHDH